MIRRPPRSTQSRSSAASDVYKRQLSDQAVRPSSFTVIHILAAHDQRPHALIGEDLEKQGMLGRPVDYVRAVNPCLQCVYATLCLRDHSLGDLAAFKHRAAFLYIQLAYKLSLIH